VFYLLAALLKVEELTAASDAIAGRFRRTRRR